MSWTVLSETIGDYRRLSETIRRLFGDYSEASSAVSAQAIVSGSSDLLIDTSHAQGTAGKTYTIATGDWSPEG